MGTASASPPPSEHTAINNEAPQSIGVAVSYLDAVAFHVVGAALDMAPATPPWMDAPTPPTNAEALRSSGATAITTRYTAPELPQRSEVAAPPTTEAPVAGHLRDCPATSAVGTPAPDSAAACAHFGPVRSDPSQTRSSPMSAQMTLRRVPENERPGPPDSLAVCASFRALNSSDEESQQSQDRSRSRDDPRDPAPEASRNSRYTHRTAWKQCEHAASHIDSRETRAIDVLDGLRME